MNEAQAHLAAPVGERDHATGPESAPVTLIEYGDYECSFCGEAYLVVKNVQRHLGDRLRFVFRNFPIDTIHPHAEQAAEAAEAAATQGKFWQMHDMLYEHQQTLGAQDLRDFAQQLGLDLDRFDRDMSEHTLADRVREDFMGGVRSGVNGTPTFFINGARYDESWDEDSLRGALEQGALSCLASMSRRAAACEFSCPWNFLMVGKKPFIGPDRMRKLSLFASAWLPRTIISPT